MDRTRLVPAVGILACLAFLAALSFPFSAGSVSTYYTSGALNPLFGGLFALVTIIVLAAGREERTDPARSAGVALALGLLIAVIVVVWLMTARTDVLSITWLHRYALAGTAVSIPIVAAWYAYALDIF
ncbi:hypothetical protein HLRTI_001360 [Halorhabdus tiamatea SARL4B]|uniref:Conserved hypothetical membrane protein (DUF1772) n=1 Tax=Halorhabdus tiamatea SARL4B TaxID=1033806 RepID=F7PI54_9EURY|nr:hypothetical protein [Halorhabdus tiamatea]ERJ06649.1 hypothetical protein HLRTI_001360 [Halorhabdus tiamatea SARL4B]CCQ32201.1 conserved hypothetical membrane protein (DUF1772) [Halorhabdus tiamatea SARL4B]